MQVAGSLGAMAAVKDRAVELACSSLLSGAAREALKSFFRSTQQGAATLRYDHLRGRLLEAGIAAPRAAQRSAAESIAALCEGSADRIAETMRLSITSLEKSGMSGMVRLPPHKAISAALPSFAPRGTADHPHADACTSILASF